MNTSTGHERHGAAFRRPNQFRHDFRFLAADVVFEGGTGGSPVDYYTAGACTTNVRGYRLRLYQGGTGGSPVPGCQTCRGAACTTNPGVYRALPCGASTRWPARSQPWTPSLSALVFVNPRAAYSSARPAALASLGQ